MENEKPILRGELALMAAIVINSFSVVLMLYSGSGISAISSLHVVMHISLVLIYIFYKLHFFHKSIENIY